MQSTLVPKLDSVWFQRRNYKIVPLNSAFSDPLLKLRQAVEQGVYASEDSNRSDFYDVDLGGSWAYIHVREDAQIIYVIAYRRFGELQAVG